MKFPCSLRGAIARTAFLIGCLGTTAPAVEIAGSLLIDLDAADYNAADGLWPQHSLTGIQGSFTKQPTGTPQLETIAGKLALVLDGDGDFLTGPNTTSALHAASAPHSVEYWAYQGQTRVEETVISWSSRSGTPGSHAAFRYGSGGAGAVGRWDTPDMNYAAPHAGGPAVGVWHHIVVTYDGTTQRTYVDGQPNASEAAVLDAKDSLPISIGTERNADGTDSGRVRQFSGAISKVRVHSAALTPEQVLGNYNLELAEHPGITTAALTRAPLHRWSFNETAGAAANGAIVSDSIGGLTGVVRGTGATFTGTGVTLPGEANTTLPAYIDLPNGLISSKQRLTFETWVTQTKTQSGSRIMSFSKSNIGEVNTPGVPPAFNGAESISLYANVGTATNMRFERVGGTFPNGANNRQSDGATLLNTKVHYAVVYDPDFKEWRLYRNGFLMEVLPETQGPTSIGDVNNWLGRSDFGADNGFAGTFDEFRVYNYTLTEGQIRGNTLAGPDTLTSAAVSPFAWVPTEGGTYAFNNAGGQDNWDPGSTFPDAEGAIANLVTNLAGDQTIELNTTATVGSLTFGDTDGSHKLTFAPGTGGILDLNAGTGFNASINQSSTSGSNEISAPLLLSSNTELANTSSTATLTLSGALSGSGSLAKAGTGQVILTADNSGYAGTLSVNSGQLRVGNGSTTGSLGSGAISLTDEGTLALNRSDATTLNSNVSGTGTLRLAGSGQVTNAGTVNMTGTTGTLSVSPASSLVAHGSITSTLAHIEGELVVNEPSTFNISDLVIGNLEAGFSKLVLSDGTVSASTIVVGKNARSSGVILQSGGVLNDIPGSMGDCYIGGGNNEAKDVWGAYRMSGGVLNTSSHFQIGSHGTGIMEIFGEAVVNFNAGYPSIGRFQNAAGDPKSRGVVDVRDGGILNQANTGSRLNVGEKATGTLNVRDGGTVNLTGGLSIGLGNANEGDGTVNLMPGGTLSTQIISQGVSGGAGIGRFNFHGGTLRARGNQPGTNASDFISGLDRAYIYPGGAVIDTNGFNIRSGQFFEDPTGNGVATIPVTNGGSGYLAPPYLEITGDGNGATAIANLTNGSVTSITVTNPGTDYTTAPTVNIMGGGAGSGLALGTPTLAANAPGKFTKTGLGTLTLNSASLYTGETIVDQGTLIINGDHGAATGKLTVDADATLGGNGFLGGEVLVNGSVNPGTLDAGFTTGMLTAVENLSFNAGSSLVIDINDAQFPTNDSIDVSGTLDISKAALKVNLTGTGTQLPYTIASFAELKGPFVSVPTGTTVVYHANSIEITAVGTPYQGWTGAHFPGQTDPAIIGPDADPDHDGSSNAQEFALGGLPNSPADKPKVFQFTADSSDNGTANELILTIAVLEGTPGFSGTPSPTASAGGYTYKVQGSTDLSGFDGVVSVVAPVVTDLDDAPDGYEYRSFKLDASDGLANRGFLRVDVSPVQ